MNLKLGKLWLLIGAIIICTFIMQSAVLANALGVPDSEYDALVALYTSTDGSNWTYNDNWLTTNPDWYGVTVEGGHVKSIDLRSNNLTGTIPSVIDSLTNLQDLILVSNQISSTIPSEIGNLTDLENLDLSHNQLTGLIPNELGALAFLHELNLGFNQLTGTIPSELGDLTNLWTLYLYRNHLTGTIPIELSNLTNLANLFLGGNQLTGTIPTELGNLTNLQALALNDSQLSGTIPVELGNLTNLQMLYLNINHLIGTIPSELGNLTNLYVLDIRENQLSGQIPVEIGNLTKLQYLYLNSNQLTGEIPSTITNLTKLSMADLGYNALTSADPAVLSFLAGKWRNTQTVPPTDASVSVRSNGRASVSWTPILYSDDDGYYEVGFSLTPGGPYMFYETNRTYDKYASSRAIYGLDLNAPIYFVVRTVSLAGSWNQSTLTSQLSQEVMLLPPASDKLSTDGSTILLQNMVVTATFPDFFYIETQERTWGIRVDGSVVDLERGARVNIVGKLHTNDDGERYIEAEEVENYPPSEIFPDPVYMTNRTLGGGDWFYNSEFGAGQRGVDGCHGLNNIGLLVKTCGVVTFAGRDWLYINDGSGLDDGSGIKGLYVDARGYPSIAEGSFVWVTGISSCDLYQGRIVNTLLAIDGGIITEESKTMTIGEEEPANPREH